MNTRAIVESVDERKVLSPLDRSDLCFVLGVLEAMTGDDNHVTETLRKMLRRHGIVFDGDPAPAPCGHSSESAGGA